MEFERWQRVEELLSWALAQPPDRRRSWLEGVCRDDPEIEREVASLLAADEEAGSGFLEEPRRADPDPGPAVEPGPDDRIGPYRLIRRIGGGGTSQVYLALRDDGEVRKQVAVKLLRQSLDRADLLRRFRLERQVLAQLEHPNIARFLDGGVTGDGRPYLVLEYVEGLPVDRYCTREGLSTRRRIELFRSVCAAVDHAHRHLVVHRDLKPANVLVTSDGTPKLLDFGIAKILAPDRFPETVALTETGLRPMTPPFASPEQVRGEPITTASDVYSLGVLLYHLLTGRLPYRPEPSGSPALERAICEEEPERPMGPAGPLSRDLEAILLMALRKEPHRRYGSAEQLAEDLRRSQDGLPVVARRATLPYRAGKFLRRHRAGAAAAAALLALLVGFTGAMAVQAGRIARERDRAVLEAQNNERIADFLQGVFAVADPFEGLGEGVSARQLLDWGAERLDRELAGQPEVRGRLLLSMGMAYSRLGVYDRAEALLRTALALRQERFGPESLEVAEVLDHLGIVVAYQGDYEGAETLLRRALELRRRLHGGDHQEVSESLNDLAFVLGSRGAYDRAEPLFREALEMNRRLFGENHSEVGITLNNLALLHKMQGDLEAAEPLYRRSLSILRRALGPDHPLVVRSTSNLATLLTERGAYTEAEVLHRESVEAARRVMGPDHDGYAMSLANLGRSLLAQGRPAEAEPIVREAAEVFARALPAGHWRTAYAESLVGTALAGQGRYEEAEALLVANLPVVQEATGERSQYTRDLLQRLAELYEGWGRPENAAEAREEWRRAGGSV